MSRLAKKTRLPAWVALLALLMQTLVPLGQMLQAAESDSTIFICTTRGIVPLNQAPPERPDRRHVTACQVCTAGLYGQAFLTPDIAHPAQVVRHELASSPDSVSWHGNQPGDSPVARGPPVFI